MRRRLDSASEPPHLRSKVDVPKVSSEDPSLPKDELWELMQDEKTHVYMCGLKGELAKAFWEPI